MRVSSIRSQNPRGFGGCIFTGIPIDDSGTVQDASAYYVVRASSDLLGTTRVQPGQWWRVAGEPVENVLAVNGYRITEWQIEPSDMNLALPSGEHIITLMAESADFQGIGRVKARRLWETFNEDLYGILDQGDFSALTAVLTEESARQVIAAWQLYGDTRTLQWLERHGFDAAVGRKVVAFFGTETPDRIEADPYRLLSFCATWQQVDALARDEFGIAETDPRRLQGAVEEALYRLFGAGHTCARLSMLLDRLAPILHVSEGNSQWRQLVPDVLAEGLSNGSYIIGTEHDVHPVGPYVMEATVARAVVDRLVKVTEAQLLTAGEVETGIAEYEASEGIALNDEQRLAVQTAAANAFAIITGGAGVGKTTVLKGLYQIYDRAGVRVVQMALAGRAAKRMQEATGRPASTIASFLRNTKDEDLAGPVVAVVDEASMVDIITMHRLCELLPPHVRLVLVGDPSQLMPVGPGLVLHALSRQPGVPSVELTVVKRYGGEIAEAAAAIRAGIWPELPAVESAPIAFIPCATSARRGGAEPADTLAETVFRLYRQSPDDAQILSPRRSGAGGVAGLNALCQERMAGEAQPLLVWSDQHESMAGTGFRLGDPLLCTRNLWDWGLQNGSLGRLVQIEASPRLITGENGEELGLALAWAEWDDGERRPIFESMLDDLELGYAITVHKAQGSQWPRVIVPVTGNRLLDRTLLYTAVTRAQRQVILVGDQAAARRAVESLPRSHERHVALGSLLRRNLAERTTPVEKR
nr:AAA family ATPase [Aromatoleum petrolei]